MESLPIERGPKSGSISSLRKGAPRFDGAVTHYLIWKRDFYIHFNDVMWVRDILWRKTKRGPIYEEGSSGARTREPRRSPRTARSSTSDTDPSAMTETGGTSTRTTAQQAATAPQQMTSHTLRSGRTFGSTGRVSTSVASTSPRLVTTRRLVNEGEITYWTQANSLNTPYAPAKPNDSLFLVSPTMP